MFPRLWPIIRKEFLHLIRDSRTLLMTFLLPIFLLIVFGYAVSYDVRNIPVAVLDHDRSQTSRDYIARFTGSGYFNRVANIFSANEYDDWLDSGRAKVIFIIPVDFAEQIRSHQKATVQILMDGSDPTWASSALSYINSINHKYYQDLVHTAFSKRGMPPVNEPVRLITRTWYNETLRSLNFFVPGLICVILMMTSATLTSQTIVSEKEQGTMEELVASPVRKNELMLGKLLPYVLIAFLDVLVVTAIGVYWFQVPFKGNILFLAVNSLIFLLGAMGIGLLVSATAHSSQEAMQIALLATLLPAITLSGFVFPLESMPWPLRVISFLIPARYFLTILRGIFLKGVGFWCLWDQMLAMSALSLIILTAAVLKFKKRID